MLQISSNYQCAERGVRWGDLLSQTWEVYYKALVDYRQEHGNLNIPTTYVDEEGFALGR